MSDPSPDPSRRDVPLPKGARETTADGKAASSRRTPKNGTPHPTLSHGERGNNGAGALTLRAVLERLRDAGALEAGAEERVRAALARPPVAGDPLFIQVLIGVGAWLAGICFFAFVVTLLGGFFHLSEKPFVALGAAWIGVAVLMHRFGSPASIFFRQLALACSVAGHAMVVLGVAEAVNYPHEVWAMAAVAVGLAVVLYRLYDDPVHRFLSALLALGFVECLCADVEIAGLFHVLVCALAVGVGLIFLHRRAPAGLRAVGYALAVSMLGVLGFALLERLINPWRPTLLIWHWPSAVSFSALLLVLTAHLCGYLWPARLVTPEARTRGRIMMLAALTALVLVVLQAPGVAAAFFVLALGFATSSHILTALGLVSLAAFLGEFYYSLHLDLLNKSLLLLGTGAVFFLLRVLVGRLFASRQGMGAGDD